MTKQRVLQAIPNYADGTFLCLEQVFYPNKPNKRTYKAEPIKWEPSRLNEILDPKQDDLRKNYKTEFLQKLAD